MSLSLPPSSSHWRLSYYLALSRSRKEKWFLSGGRSLHIRRNGIRAREHRVREWNHSHRDRHKYASSACTFNLKILEITRYGHNVPETEMDWETLIYTLQAIFCQDLWVELSLSRSLLKSRLFIARVEEVIRKGSGNGQKVQGISAYYKRANATPRQYHITGCTSPSLLSY